MAKKQKDENPTNLLYTVGFDSKGKQVIVANQGTNDPQGDYHIMSSFRLLNESVALRGITLKGTKLGSLYLHSTPPDVDIVPKSLRRAHSMACQLSDADIARMSDKAVEYSLCDVQADGSCISDKDCPHGPALTVAQLHAGASRLNELLSEIGAAWLRGDAGRLSGLLEPYVAQQAEKLALEQVEKDWPTEIQNLIGFRNANAMDKAHGSERCKQELVEMLALDDEPRWKWILSGVNALQRQAADGLKAVSDALALADGVARGTSCPTETLKALVKQRDDLRLYVEQWTPELNRYRVWADGTIQLIEENASGVKEQPHSWMSDDFTEVMGANYEHAYRTFHAKEKAAWVAKEVPDNIDNSGS